MFGIVNGDLKDGPCTGLQQSTGEFQGSKVWTYIKPYPDAPGQVSASQPNYSKVIIAKQRQFSKIKLQTQKQTQFISQVRLIATHLRKPSIMITMRTLFWENGLPVFESYEDSPSLQWVNVFMNMTEEILTDLELMDVIIERIQKVNIIMTNKPKQLEMKLVVSFPLLNPSDSFKDRLAYVIALANYYRDGIIDGRISIDRDDLFWTGPHPLDPLEEPLKA